MLIVSFDGADPNRTLQPWRTMKDTANDLMATCNMSES
jgi:hypothetical protein